MTFRLRSHRWVLLALAWGCGDGSTGSQIGSGINGGQTGEEGGPLCQAVQTSRLAWSERSPLDFSADEVLAAVGGEHSTRLTYEAGTSTTLQLSLARGEGPVEYQEREYVSDGSGAEIAVPECPDVVAVPVELTFSTADGAFAETWNLVLLAETRARASAQIQLDLDGLRGNFSVSADDAAASDDVGARLELTLDGSAWSGTIVGQATQTSGAGPDGSVSAREFDIASF